MSFLTGGRHNVTTKADKITEFQATTCEYNAVPLLIGTCKVGANLVEFSALESQEIRTSVKTGKHSRSTTIDYKYYSKLVLALGEGAEDIGLRRVWVGGKEYASLAALNNSKEEGSGLTYAANGGTPYVQHYEDLAMLYGRVYLGYNSANVPSYNFEVAGLLRSSRGANGTDANPADVIKYLLSLLGRDTLIDEESLEHYRQFCTAMGILVSTPGDYFNDQKTAHDIIAELLTLTNTYMFWSIDSYKFVPLYPKAVGSWKPDVTVQYSLDENDYSSFSFKRKDSSQQYNAVKVEFTNRGNNYEKESINYIDTASVQAQGVRQVSHSANWLHTKEAAVKLAKMMAEKYLNEVVEYSLKLPWTFSRLEPGDLIEINNSTLGIKDVARISEIAEDKNGIMSIKAISTPIDSYKVANYTVSNSYQFIDYNIEGGDTAAPIFLTPPSELTTAASGIEVWCAFRGVTNDWGGCQVYNSFDDEYYAYSGQQLQEALVGRVLADNDAQLTIRLDNLKQQELLPDQLIYVDGEIFRYAKAVLLDTKNTYRLDGVERGQYNTLKATHGENDTLVVLDNAIYVVQLLKEHVGKTLYFKLPSFNMFKGQLQDVNALDSYSFVVGRYDIPNVSNITAVASGWAITDSINTYEINVSWTKPDWADYECALIYYKNSTHSQWTYADRGDESAKITQALPGDTYTIAVCVKDVYGNFETPDSAPKVTCAVEVTSETPNTPTGFSVRFTDTIMVAWGVVTNAVIRRYEVRSSTNLNDAGQLLYSGTGNNAAIQLSSRTGKLYLWAIACNGQRSTPAVLEYSKPEPAAPNFNATAGFRNITLTYSDMPANCYAVRYTLIGVKNSYEVITRDSVHTLQADSDIYRVQARWVDVFGVGAKAETDIMVDQYIDPAAVHVTEQTVFEKGVIVEDMLSTGAVTANKININGGKKTGARVVIDTNLIRVYDENNVLRVQLGIWD